MVKIKQLKYRATVASIVSQLMQIENFNTLKKPPKGGFFLTTL